MTTVRGQMQLHLPSPILGVIVDIDVVDIEEDPVKLNQSQPLRTLMANPQYPNRQALAAEPTQSPSLQEPLAQPLVLPDVHLTAATHNRHVDVILLSFILLSFTLFNHRLGLFLFLLH